MTDNNENNKEEKATEQKKALPPLIIAAQYIKDLSFEAPGVPMALVGMKEAPTLDLNFNINANHIKDNQFEVILTIKVQANNHENKALFVCELAYGALANVNVPKEHIEPLLMIEVPRLVFPFARQIIADLSKESGLPPVVLAPIDFFAIYQNGIAGKAAAAAAAEANEQDKTQLN